MKEFISGYMGESDYRINGTRYRVKISASAYERSVSTSPDIFDHEILPRVGTVYGLYDEFPPADVVSMFPGYVASRYNHETKRIETRGKPDTVSGFHGDLLTARAWVDELTRMGLA